MVPNSSFSAQHTRTNSIDNSTSNTPTALKKRSRSAAGSISGPAGSPSDAGSDAGGGDDKAKPRKKRLGLSCSECRRRKISCDRKQPCSACIRRKVPHSCSWEDDPESGTNFALDSDVRHLARRLAHLESLFQQTNPDLLPPGGIAASLLANGSPSGGRDGRATSPLSETEDAAMDLEDVAFGAKVAVLKAVSAANNANSAQAQRRIGGAQGGNGSLVNDGLGTTKFGTSVLAEPLSFDQDGRPRSAVRLGLDLAVGTGQLPQVRSQAMAQIYAVLPGKQIGDALIEKYLNEMQWDFRVLDPEAFVAEHQRYCELLESGRQDLIDPLWVALLCMVFALSLDGFWSRPSGARDLSLFGGLTERELMDLPSVWHDGALRALQLGEWGGTPRIRTIQTIILMGQYIQISSSSGISGRYLGWLASGVRVAQRMGLHRLGSDPELMPPDDPALPPGRNQLKRELSVRLWNHLVVIDSLMSDSPALRCYILHPTQYTTSRPLNLNMAELARDKAHSRAAYPPVSHTDASFELVLCSLAEQIRRALDESNGGAQGGKFNYSNVLDQDKRLRAVLEQNLPDVFSVARQPPIDSHRLKYQRALLHEAVYARIVRLHRPYLSRGYQQGSPFEKSTTACVTAARRIIESNHELLAIETGRWWMFVGTLSAGVVLFMDLFHAIDGDSPEKDINDKRETLVKAAVIFSTQVASPALQAVVEQGRRILAGLFAAEESRRIARAASALSPDPNSEVMEPFAHVLKRISREVAAEEAFVPGSTNYSLPPGSVVPPTAFLTSPSAPVMLQPQTTLYNGMGTTPGREMGGAGGAVQAGGYDGWEGGGGQDFTSFFDTLASEDWGQVGGGGLA